MTYSWVVNIYNLDRLIKTYIVKTEGGEDPYSKVSFSEEEKKKIDSSEYSVEIRFSRQYE